MESARHGTRTTAFPWHHVRVGALIGVIAALFMGVRSMEAGMAGDTFEIFAGPALLGLALHLVTGAFWGAIFGLIVSTGRLRGAVGLVAGVVYGWRRSSDWRRSS